MQIVFKVKICGKDSLRAIPYCYQRVSGSKKCLLFGNIGVLCFLETPVLRFARLPYARRLVNPYLVLENLLNLYNRNVRCLGVLTI